MTINTTKLVQAQNESGHFLQVRNIVIPYSDVSKYNKATGGGYAGFNLPQGANVLSTQGGFSYAAAEFSESMQVGAFNNVPTASFVPMDIGGAGTLELFLESTFTTNGSQCVLGAASTAATPVSLTAPVATATFGDAAYCLNEERLRVEIDFGGLAANLPTKGQYTISILYSVVQEARATRASMIRPA
jgi:hypothetical protein